MSPFRTGIALATTVGVFYALCTLAWVLAPNSFLGFMNDLFHGLSFDGMVRSTGFDPGGFVVALVVMVVWAFLAGSFFGWLARRLAA